MKLGNLTKINLLLITLVTFLINQVVAASASQLSSFSSLAAEADPQSGSANMTIPIEVPPGRLGIQPNIQIQYNSNLPNGIAGVGWNFELGSIQRSTKKGVPQYNTSDMFIVRHAGSVQELVSTGGNLYAPSIEGAFGRIEFVNNSYWLLTDRTGTKYCFGETSASQEVDPANANKIYRWSLSKVEDIFGNTMTFSYTKDENQLYPDTIDYASNPNGGLSAYARVKFTYQSRSDYLVNRMPGFAIKIKKLLTGVEVYANETLQRKYEFIYVASARTGRSILNRVKQYGSDAVSILPDVVFNYQSQSNPTYSIQSQSALGVSGNNLWNAYFGGGYDRGGSNYGPMPPNAFDTSMASYGAAQSGPFWSTSSKGNLSISGGKDAAYWFSTYVYVDTTKTLSFGPSGNGGDWGIWVNQQYSPRSRNYSITVQGGQWNQIDVTDYDQSQGFQFYLNKELANEVVMMNSIPVALKQYFSGDFNGDARTDLATFDSAAGRVDVLLSSGDSFLTARTWITNFGANKQINTGDFNGDGRADLVVFDSGGQDVQVAFSSGADFATQGQWSTNINGNFSMTAGDFNGDGLSDLIVFYKGGGLLKVQPAFNRGSYFEKVGNEVVLGTEAYVPLTGDFNGDGLLDYASIEPASGTWKFFINQSGDPSLPMFQLSDVTGFGTNEKTILADFNQDGVTDIGYYEHSSGKIKYRLCVGEEIKPGINEVFAPGFSLNSTNAYVQTADFNADGLNDYMVLDGTSGPQIAYAQGSHADLLSMIDNSVGGLTSITYAPIDISHNTYLPFPVSVVMSIIRSNAQGDSYTAAYSYSGGLWDILSREFRGFGYTKVTDPAGNYLETTTLQDNIYKGRVAEQRQYNSAGNLIGKSVNTWQNQTIAAGSNFVFLKRQDNYIYDGDASGKRIAEEYFYDESPQVGNLTKLIKYGEVDLTTGNDVGNDKQTLETTYVKNTSIWIWGLPNLITVKDNNDQIKKKTWLYYDGQDNATAPIKGLLTKKERWAGGGTAANPITQYSYDVYGNLKTTTDAKNNVTQIFYDSAYQLFPIKTVNALTHQLLSEYYGVDGVPLNDGLGFRGLWGQLKSTTDPNNQKGKKVYDAFGRVVKTISPLDSITFPTTFTQYTFYPAHIMTIVSARKVHGESATVDSYQYADGLGRLIQTKHVSENPGQYVVSGQTEYNSRGLPSKKYLAYFTANLPTTFDAIDPSKPSTRIDYDGAGRVIKATNPDGFYATISYNDWTTTTIDENGHMQKSYVDAYGRLIKKEEYRGADGRGAPTYPVQSFNLYATTLYTYDFDGNLLTTQDAKAHVTTMNYDPLGRKISMTDPDMGLWRYEYDLNGNLSKQTDAKGQTIDFYYDKLNRLTNKTDHANLNVNYTYDDDTVLNSKGRLTKAQYGTLDKTSFEYDTIGREVRSIKDINTKAFAIDSNFNALNQLDNLNLPNQQRFYYKYNPAGQVEQISNDPSAFTN